MSTHTISVRHGEQAGRARARVAALLAARLQHQSLAVGPTERPGHLAAHPARRLPRALARADREADAQARQRAAGHRARPDESLERELALITVTVSPDRRAELVVAQPGRRRARRRHRPRRGHLRGRRPPRPGRGVRGARAPLRRARARPHRPRSACAGRARTAARTHQPSASERNRNGRDPQGGQRRPPRREGRGARATAARATRTRSTSPTPASTSWSACARARSRGRPPRRRACR